MYSEFAMKYTTLALALLVISPGLANAQKPANQNKTVVYNDCLELVLLPLASKSSNLARLTRRLTAASAPFCQQSF